MIGNITQTNSRPLEEANPNAYIMDIRTYTWVDLFEFTNTEPISTNVTTKTESISTQTKIIIASIGGIVGTAIIIIGGFLIYIWNKKRKEQPTPILTIPGTTTVRYNHYEQ